MKPILTLTYAISLSLIINSSVIAQGDNTHFGSKIPTADEFTKSLKIDMKTRGIGKVKSTAVSLSLPFEFDSATLTQAAKTTLNSLGIALKRDELNSYIFKIKGHTDAIGEARYNSSLSQQRADAVKNYLANNYSVSSSRLKSIGKGETELFDPKHPGAPSNRRVEIINTGTKTK